MPVNAEVSTRWKRSGEILLALAALACVALATIRCAENISFRAPLQLVTSGAEEEALFSIWNFAHGQPVYPDPLVIPYTASYFNWLFYALYGAVAGATLRLFHLDDAWLPTICRLVTLVLALAGGAAFYAAGRGSGPRIAPRLLVPLAIVALFNPLCGLWIITARPDLGAATLELAGVALFFRYLRTGGVGWMVVTALALEAAWGFKQTALSAFAGISLALLLQQRWRDLALLGGLWSGGVLVALATLGPNYRHSLYFSQVHAGFYPILGVRHFLAAIGKMPFILVALGAIPFVTWARKAGGPRDPVEMTAGLTLLAAFVLEAFTSCKAGAADYYFIPLGLWCMLGLTLAAPRLAWSGWNAARAAASCLMIFGIAGIFLGWRGTLDCRDPHDKYDHLAHRLATRPGPVYVQDTYGDLPWISPTTPHFVIAFLYEMDRGAGVRFERGGWESLLSAGYFATVVTAPDEPDIGPLLGRYRFVREEDGFRYFERK